MVLFHAWCCHWLASIHSFVLLFHQSKNWAKGLYFYEVDLAGTQGKSDKALLDLLKQNGTQSYKATIKVYGAKDGKADLSNLVATKDLTVNLNGYKSLNPMKSKMPAASQDKDGV